MANILGIYSGPGDISLYDAVNGVLPLGHVGNIEINVEGQKADIFDANQVQFSSIVNLNALLLQTDYTLLSALKNRKPVKQEIMIVTNEMLITIADAFISYKPMRNTKPGEPHSIELTAKTGIENNMQILTNLLGTYGNMNTRGTDDHIALGWETNIAYADRNFTTSPWTGRGLAQYASFSDPAHYLRIFRNCRFEGNRKFYMSAYIDPVGGTEINMQVAGYDLSENITALFSEVITLDDTGRYSISGVMPESGGPYKLVKCEFTYASSLVEVNIDDVQLELGDLTDYHEDGGGGAES